MPRGGRPTHNICVDHRRSYHCARARKGVGKLLGYYLNSRSPDQECPRCGGSVARIRRHLPDRLYSAMVVTVHRYRCEQLSCNWEGRLKVAQNVPRIEPLLYWLTNDSLRHREGPVTVARDPSSRDG